MLILWASLGLLLIAVVIWQVFNDLFHPAGTAGLSDWIGRTLFDALKRVPRALPLAGPLTLVTVIGVWVAALVLGFAFLYVPAYPTGFRTSTGALPPSSPRWLTVGYFSLETLITLGYGDLVPQSALIRYVASVEGLVGFALLTASVSSIVLLYPALSRMRLLARGVSHIVNAEKESGVELAASESDTILSALARQVTHARIDLVHFPIVYFFVANDQNASVAMWVRELVRLAAAAGAPHRPVRVRLAGRALDSALHDFAAIVEGRFLHTRSANRDAIFTAFMKDHLIR